MNERCHICNKKLKLMGFDCKCNKNIQFCSKHRLDHNCEFDYKNKSKNELIKISTPKIDKI